MVATTTKEFIVALENRPGTLAEIATALGRSNVNINGFALQAQGDFGQFRFVTDDTTKAEQFLKGTRYSYRTREAVTVHVPNRPGELAKIAQKLTSSGINIEASYPLASTGTEPQIAFSVHDVPSALKILQ
ncbi:MAG: ACT domain-containing protein [Methanobacteriota archaeon]